MIGYIIVLVLGVIVLLFVGRSILLGRRSRSWPTVVGTILGSSLQVNQSTDDNGSTTTTYGVALRFKYSVSGQEYQGARRTFTDVSTSSRRRAEQILARYPQGGSVTVYYDPDNPSSCALEPGVGGTIYVFLALAVILFMVGLAGVVGLI